MTQLTCAEVRDLIPVYALGALDADEAVDLEEHLAACPACRAELARYERVTDALAMATPQPPPAHLRERLLASVDAPASPAPRPVTLATPGEAKDPAAPHRIMLARPVAAVLAMAAMLLVAALATLAILLDDARDDRAAAIDAQAQLASYLSAGGEAIPLQALEAADYGDSRGYGQLVLAPGKDPLLVVGGCPPTSDDLWYRVWVARDGDRTPIGDLEVQASGDGWLAFSPPESLSSYDQVGVTLVTEDWGRADVFVGPVSAQTFS